MLKCLISFGKKEQFYGKLDEMKEQFSQVVDPLLIIDTELVQGYMYACLGMRERMPDWLADFRLENCSRAIRNIRSGCMTYGRLLCSEKNWEHLDIVGDEMLVPYANTVHIFPMIVGYIYKAIAKYNMGQKVLAADYLKKAVNYAEKDDLVIPFIENGSELMPIIQELMPDEFLSHIIEQSEQYEKGKYLITGGSTDDGGLESQAGAGLLTRREAELMDYVREGLRNAEIGEKMHIAQVTVEKNLTSIYRKLGVKNRTAAIRMLDELQGYKV